MYTKMAPRHFWVFVVVISICVIPASLRSRREMMKAALLGEVEILAQRSPVLVVHHGSKQGRGIVVRGIEHVYSDLHQMGILVRKTEEPSLDAPFVEIKFLNSTFVFPGDPTQQAQVMRWALHTVECAKDAVVEVTEAQMSILTRFLTSFSVIYGYGVPRSDLLWEQLAKTTNLCLKSGNTLVFKADGDLAPQSLYLPLEKEPALVLYAHNIPLIYTGNMEPQDILEWLAETHDTDTNMVKLSSRNLHRIVALERTVLVLFFLKSDPSPLIAQSNCSSKLDRLGVVAVGLENLGEVEGLGVEQLPALVMFKHGLPIIYSGEMTVDSLDKMLSWVSRESDRREKILITGIESLNPLSRKDFEVDHSHPSTILVKPHRDAVQKLSIEYARLARENERLRNIINTAITVLGDHEEREIKPSSPLRAECGDCAGSIGQAIWDCGTLDIDCIKNCIDATSQCFGCICEVLDFWWQKDAPNCYRKEIVTIMEDEKVPDPTLSVDVSVQTEDEAVPVVEESIGISPETEEFPTHENEIETFFGKSLLISIFILLVTLVSVYHLM